MSGVKDGGGWGKGQVRVGWGGGENHMGVRLEKLTVESSGTRRE